MCCHQALRFYAHKNFTVFFQASADLPVLVSALNVEALVSYWFQVVIASWSSCQD